MHQATIEIPLTQGKFALIDIIDQDLFQFNWFYHDGYAVRMFRPRGTYKRLTIRMHRLVMERILGRELSLDEFVDHIDGNRSNNCRANLRIATQSQNLMNVGKRRHSTSPYKGVSHVWKTHKWRAVIVVNGLAIRLGSYYTPEEAAQAYNEAALLYHGEYAHLNILPQT